MRAPRGLVDLKIKSAVVTGAGGGLGAWIAAGLAAAGLVLLPITREVHRPDCRGDP